MRVPKAAHFYWRSAPSQHFTLVDGGPTRIGPTFQGSDEPTHHGVEAGSQGRPVTLRIATVRLRLHVSNLDERLDQFGSSFVCACEAVRFRAYGMYTYHIPLLNGHPMSLEVRISVSIHTLPWAFLMHSASFGLAMNMPSMGAALGF